MGGPGAAVSWEQLGSFAFNPDIEKKSLDRQVRPDRGALLARCVTLPSSQREEEGSAGVVGFASESLLGVGSTAVAKGDARGPGLKIQLPQWFHDASESQAFAFCAAAIFAMYYRSGGDEAVLALDGVPPVTMMNPFSNAPLQDEPFADVISDVTLKLFTDESSDAGRRKIAEELQKLTGDAQTRALVGGACIVHRRTFERIGVEAFMAAFDLVWVVEYLGSKLHQITIDVIFNGTIYSPISASNWLQMIKTIVGTKNLKSTTIREMNVLDEEMRRRLLHEWQPEIMPREEYNKTVAQLFAEAMAEHVKNPAKELAVIDPVANYNITYSELDEWSTKVAIYLQTEVCVASKHRFGVDAVCALHMPRCGDWYVWMLGVLKAGGCYLSLDPDFPADRLSYILEDSCAMCLITKSDMIGTLQYDGGPVIPIDTVQRDVIDRIKVPDAVRRALAGKQQRQPYSRGQSPAAEGASSAGPQSTEAIPDDAPWHTFVAASTPHTPAYMIYTSGSTGKPKGVCVENINCVTFVLSERELFKLGNYHRVIQGFSTSFDASVEEIWLAFASGSALIAVQKKVMQDSEALQELIVAHHATVLSTVPTLLATMEPSMLKQLTLVIVGGEACNKEVVEMYATGGHRMFVNSYGPTEATVACCAKFCSPDEPVTIGRAQPNYYAVITDPESRVLLPPGVPGELCMVGPAVTRGYVNREELTKEKFVHCNFFPHTHETHGEDFSRMYRTGDLVRWTVDGNIEFLGRIDSQVKLRGFRIEVSEIENVLSQYRGVTTAVVVLRNDNGMPFLCAYIIADEELMDEFRESLFRDHLKKSLPTYMIPSRFVPIRVLPRSPAGKLDRKGFPEPEPQKHEDEGREGDANKEKVKPSTPTEFLLMDIWAKHFPGQTLGIDDNFFEIGGHSLLAGKVASEVRRGGFDGFSIRYLYSHPTIRQLAASLDTMRSLTKAEPVSTVLPQRESPSFIKRVAFMIIHLLVMHVVFMVMTGYVFFFLWGYGAWRSALVSLVGDIASIPVEGVALVGSGVMTVFGYTFVVLPIIKWTLIWRFREGEYSIWSWFYIRWWAVRMLSNLVPLYFFSGTVFTNMYMRVMGASIGRNVTYMPGTAFDFDLIRIGPDSAIGHETLLAAHEVIDSVLVLRPIEIGRSCSVGARCCVKGGAVMEDESMLQHLSLLSENHRCGVGEVWSGSPATKVGLTQTLDELLQDSNQMRPTASAYAGLINEEASLLSSRSMRGRAERLGAAAECFIALLHFLFFVLLGVLCTTPVMSIFLTIWRLVENMPPRQYYIIALGTIGASPFVIAIIFLYVHLIIIALRWIVLPWKVLPGNYSCRSSMFHRKLFFDILMRVSLLMCHSLYASIYTQYLLRALGCDVGRRVECSNLFGFTPGLIRFGNETFVADFVGVNPPTIFRGVMMLGCAEIDDRAFVGNGAVLPSKIKLHQRSLLGLLSHPSRDLEAGSTYIGSPAFSIPRQAQNDDSNDTSATYKPTTCLVIQRCMWEFFRTVTPAACISIATVASFIAVSFLIPNLFNLREFAIVINLFVWTNVLIIAVMMLAIKWVVVGREHPARYPLWSTGVWRAEFVVDCTTVLGNATFLSAFRGTPFIAPFFRLLGAKIGRDCYIDTMFFTEPDMVTIGDNCCIGDRVTIQTHLFEDRVMKVEPLTIGDRVSIGPLSIVLYNTSISRGATIGALSLVMKGEAYPPGTHWEGVPAQRRGIPAPMAVAPPSIPKVTLQPPSQQPTSNRSRKSSAAPKSGGTRGGGAGVPTIAVDVEAIRDALLEWLLDDGAM